ncbi:hypothetical protein LCGC14_3081600, partial [marine sediment metagenome]
GRPASGRLARRRPGHALPPEILSKALTAHSGPLSILQAMDTNPSLDTRRLAR